MNLPLVSICVVTYNSARFLLSTLDSIKGQSYAKIELIISDDCSTDATISISERWLDANKSRFESSCISRLSHNSGIPANCNNAISNCRGEWVLLIAGDDLLTPNAISDYVDYIKANPDASIIFSLCQWFVEKNSGFKYGKITPNEQDIDTLRNNNEGQLYSLLYRNYLPAVSHITKRELALKFPFDETYRLCEDYPLWLKLSYNNVRFYLLEKVTALYRQHESVSISSNRYVNEQLLLDNEKLFFDIIYPKNKKNESLIRYKRAVFFMQEFEVILLNNNKSNYIGRLVLRFIRKKVSKWAGINVPF